MKKLMLLALFFSTLSQAEEVSLQDKVMTLSMCSAISAIVGAQTEGFAGEMIVDVAKQYRTILVDLTDDPEFADLIIERTMGTVQDRYNKGDNSWEDLVNFSKACAMELP